LHWNERQRQKSFVVVESNRMQQKSSQQGSVGRQNSISHPTSRSASSASLSKLAQTSPPQAITTSANQSRRPQTYTSSPSSSGSDVGQDEVFAMFGNDESFSPPMYRHRRSSAGGWSESSSSSSADLNADDSNKPAGDDHNESSDESDGDEDGFVGWSDDELHRARQLAAISHDMHKFNVSNY
jgi:hypothetical protein